MSIRCASFPEKSQERPKKETRDNVRQGSGRRKGGGGREAAGRRLVLQEHEKSPLSRREADGKERAKI